MAASQREAFAKRVVELNYRRTFGEPVQALAARSKSSSMIFDHASALMNEAAWKLPPRHPQWCLHLLDHPHLIADPDLRGWLVEVLKVTRRRVAERKPLRPKDVAALVDWLRIGDRMSLEEARDAIAASTGKPRPTVKKNHQRYGQKIGGTK